MIFALKMLLPAFTAFITWQSLAPSSGPALFWDKGLHFAAYLLFALVTLPWTRGLSSRLFGLCAAVFVYSAALEVIQHFLPTRQMDVLDLVANGLGVLVGVASALVIVRLTPTGWRSLLLGERIDTHQNGPACQ